MTPYHSSLSTEISFIVWISIMSVLLLYNLHNLCRWLKLCDAPKALLFFLWVLWLCKLMYHKLGWIWCWWMLNRNFDLVRMSTLLRCTSDRMRMLHTTAALNRRTSVLFSQLLLEDGRGLQSSVRRRVVLFC